MAKYGSFQHCGSKTSQNAQNGLILSIICKYLGRYSKNIYFYPHILLYSNIKTFMVQGDVFPTCRWKVEAPLVWITTLGTFLKNTPFWALHYVAF